MTRGLHGRPVIFGEVLFDRFPGGKAVLGGAPFNVAWHLQAFGAAPLFVSRVGDDGPGRDIAAAMESWGLATCGLQVDGQHPTGAVNVTIRDGEPSYEIAADSAYDHISADELPDTTGSALVYHGSLALRGEVSRRALDRLLQTSGVPVFLDVNLRPPWWSRGPALDWIGRSRWLKLNEAELAELAPGQADAAQRAAGLASSRELSLIVTRGAAGVWFRDGSGRVLTPRPVRARQVVDTVGAGDAFSAIAILGLLRGWSWEVILERAQQFAAGIVGLRGAIPESAGFYTVFNKDWELP